MKYNRILAVLTLALMSGAALPVSAQVVEGAKIIVLDQKQLFDQSAAGQDGNRQLKPLAEALETKFKGYQDSFQKEKEGLDQMRAKAIVSEPDLGKKLEDLQRRANNANEEINAKKADLQRSSQYVNYQIVQALQPIMQEVMTARGANIVMERGNVVLASPAVDVTTVVIQKLNAKLPRVSITVPAQTAAPAKK